MEEREHRNKLAGETDLTDLRGSDVGDTADGRKSPLPIRLLVVEFTYSFAPNFPENDTLLCTDRYAPIASALYQCVARLEATISWFIVVQPKDIDSKTDAWKSDSVAVICMLPSFAYTISSYVHRRISLFGPFFLFNWTVVRLLILELVQE